MNRILLASALFFAANQAVARCDYPTQLKDIPNGEVATKEEMTDAQKAIKTYLADMNEFLDCLAVENDALGDDEANADKRSVVAARHNAAVDQMEQTGEEFNVAVRAYKARLNN